MDRRYARPGLFVLGLTLSAASLLGGMTRLASAQMPAALDDQTLLALVLAPLSDGSRPQVHLRARADQTNGPGGLATVFVVALYTRQTSSGTEEREVVNYVQYSTGNWTPARPRDIGTLLVSDWAWLSLNLTGLSAAVTGTGISSQYTVHYTSSGPYGGRTRGLSLEEVYASDLSLTSATVLSDSAGIAVAQPPQPGSISTVALAAPNNVSATALDSTDVRVDWTTPAGADSIQIVDALTNSLVKTVAGNATSTLLGGLDPSSQYCVVLYAVNQAGTSAPSAQACTVTPG